MSDSKEPNNNSSVPLASYMRSIKNNILLSRVIFALVVLCIILASGYAAILPLKTTELKIIEYKSGLNNFVTVANAGENLSSNKILIGMFLRRYVVDRENIDKITEKMRYPRVYAMSNDKVASNFKKVYGDKKALYYRKGFKRAVSIKRDDSLSYGVHQVELTTVDYNDDKEGELTQEWVATIAYRIHKRNVAYDEALFNPVGIIITEYSLSRRNK